ncbi:hypothetical protein AHiyo8_22460 [Arthrobacter sp. Hiyo8]|nr:hypothetical protein AHiyo8_22460 [Arthrobacter sp. Hiyo8]
MDLVAHEPLGAHKRTQNMAAKARVNSTGPAVEVCAPETMTAMGMMKAIKVAMPSSHHKVPLMYSWKFRQVIQLLAAQRRS